MKGVSPIVATVMLIVIVVSLVAIVSGWLNSFVTDARETVRNRTDTSVGCTGSSLSIDGVYVSAVNGTFSNARVVVKNDGVIDGQQIVSAQFFNTTGGNFSATTALPAANFNRGTIKTILFENMTAQNCTAFSQVIMATQCSSTSSKTTPLGC